MAFDPTAYPPATAHDPLEEVFSGIYLVRGSLQMNALMRFNRNMVILRDGDDLTILNSVRLSAEGERQLESLGSVRHVMRLGYFHGRDDRYYVDRYQAEFWAPEGSRAEPGPVPDHLLHAGAQLPVADTEVFLFRETRFPEAVLLVKRNDGILLTADCLQYYTDRRFCSPFARVMMPLMGFPLRMLIGPLWLKAMTPEGGTILPDFRRLEQLSFDNMLGAHGSLRRGDACEAVQGAISTAFAGQ